ncbi:MAG: hypothetical protein H0U57_13030 [Tatlockia sp.]|nr:hypothetical protein [Tatlockia sp.]
MRKENCKVNILKNRRNNHWNNSKVWEKNQRLLLVYSNNS